MQQVPIAVGGFSQPWWTPSSQAEKNLSFEENAEPQFCCHFLPEPDFHPFASDSPALCRIASISAIIASFFSAVFLGAGDFCGGLATKKAKALAGKEIARTSATAVAFA